MSEVKKSNASVADYLAFESLPEETKSLIQRLYGDHLTPVDGMYTKEDMEDAYESGWEDCAEEIERPWMSSSHFEYYLKSRKKAP
jgi:hypothetical protein